MRWADKYKYSVVAVCESLHSAIKGSGDPLSEEETAELAKWLALRLDRWDSPCSEYDSAVYSMGKATLNEVFAR